MRRNIDVDDLIDAYGVAEVLGLANPNGVSVYRRRYSDFPTPVIDKGRCLLWIRGEVELWERKRRSL